MKKQSKCLFISQAVANRNNGGGQFVGSLITLLTSIFGKENLTICSLSSRQDENYTLDENNIISFYEKPNFLGKLVNILNGNPSYISQKTCVKICQLIKSKHFDYIFLGFPSYFGLCKMIKAITKSPVLVMYQGVANKGRLSKNKFGFYNPSELISLNLTIRREKKVAKIADIKIVHNDRDKELFIKNYHVMPDLFLPVFINDKRSDKLLMNPGIDCNKFSLLFVGSYFLPNVHGLNWFVENVIPFLSENIELYVVGQGMEKLNQESIYSNKRIHIIGEVPELESWYQWSNVIIEPIFEGDGMKTKTVEAMMYGKTIIGTNEAFCGYNVPKRYFCNTKQEFIDSLNQFSKEKPALFDAEMRQIYLDNYSLKKVIEIVENKLKSI